MTDDERARELWEQGTKRLSEDQVEEAVKLFEQSIAVKPTAEGGCVAKNRNRTAVG